MVGDLVYSISAVDNTGNAVGSFSQNLTLTFTYTDGQISGLDESTLTVYMWDGTQWVALTSTVNAGTNTITATTNHLSYFALMGEKKTAVILEKPIAEMTIPELKAKIKEIIQALISLIQQLIALLQGQLQSAISGNLLTENLKYGDSGDQVKLLQTWLAKDSEVYPEALATGWFGSLTQQAVIKFQEKYKSEILTPLGLDSGTGLVGSATRAKLNALYGQAE